MCACKRDGAAWQGKLQTHVATLQEHFKEEEDMVPQLRATFPYQEYHAVSQLHLRFFLAAGPRQLTRCSATAVQRHNLQS
jgi:hypothetical protein